MTLEEKIISALEEKKIGYEIVEHEPVYTNPAMAEALNVGESETVKSLVLKTKDLCPLIFLKIYVMLLIMKDNFQHNFQLFLIFSNRLCIYIIIMIIMR